MRRARDRVKQRLEALKASAIERQNKGTAQEGKKVTHGSSVEVFLLGSSVLGLFAPVPGELSSSFIFVPFNCFLPP